MHSSPSRPSPSSSSSLLFFVLCSSCLSFFPYIHLSVSLPHSSLPLLLLTVTSPSHPSPLPPPLPHTLLSFSSFCLQFLSCFIHPLHRLLFTAHPFLTFCIFTPSFPCSVAVPLLLLPFSLYIHVAPFFVPFSLSHPLLFPPPSALSLCLPFFFFLVMIFFLYYSPMYFLHLFAFFLLLAVLHFILHLSLSSVHHFLFFLYRSFFFLFLYVQSHSIFFSVTLPVSSFFFSPYSPLLPSSSPFLLLFSSHTFTLHPSPGLLLSLHQLPSILSLLPLLLFFISPLFPPPLLAAPSPLQDQQDKSFFDPFN